MKKRNRVIRKQVKQGRTKQPPPKTGTINAPQWGRIEILVGIRQKENECFQLQHQHSTVTKAQLRLNY